MNKKIWIGLASVLLILILVLGIQMGNEDFKSEPESKQELSSETKPFENQVEQSTANINEEKENNLETPEVVRNQAGLESTEELGIPVEQDIQEKTSVEPTTKVPEPQEELPSTSKEKELSSLTNLSEGKYVTLSVSVETLLDKKDVMNQEKIELVPEDGWMFSAQRVEFYDGETAFNVLLREMKKNKIHMEYVATPIYNSNYIEGIGNIYEFDCGELSGWLYVVNDRSPNLGSSNYILKDGDVVKLVYTCDLGRDLGFEFNE